MKIGVGGVMIAKDADMEDNTREGRTRRIMKEVVRRFHAVAVKNIFYFNSRMGRG